ncbi:Molybdenum cofactor sulfurase [Merluccius polli]|uniref:Molybdenum cofactor sulfurase n=1 Tax=Merluccius polli TaxID=89951 RepID=A0AA47NT69_MERPO|nr:Molybdenum cofactor sulfurase [Merluccius polli]
MDFSRLCTLGTFREVCTHYGYSGNLEDLVQEEFPRLKGVTYLDHAGATLYPDSAVREFSRDISRNVYGNPHSHNPSSKLTHDTVDRVRYRILQHFHATPEEYSVIFTSGCTAALKLVAEAFPWVAPTAAEPGSLFCYLTDNHTSVVGIRGPASAQGALPLPVSPRDVEGRARDGAPGRDGDRRGACQTPHLFCYPAQSNFSGRKYPLGHARGIRAGRLYPACEHRGRWFVLLDAASHAGCSPLDLQRCAADFVPVSFYKMFGFPTGLGALLVRNQAAGCLRKSYFGGGTAAAYLAGENYFVPTANLSDRFEDGTISFLDIIALNHSFDALQRITGGMDNIQLHAFGLARYTHMLLSSLCHGNGRPVAQMYTQGQFESPSTQGAILNFNLLDCHGHIIGYSQVDKLASLYNIHLRTGCFCNTGACQHFLDITDQAVKKNLQAGHVCGDSIDLVDGKPTGSVRVSFGYMSTFDNCRSFLNFVADCFVEKPVRVDQVKLENLRQTQTAMCRTSNQKPLIEPVANEQGDETRRPTEPPLDEYGGHSSVVDTSHPKSPYTLTNIYIYPIKSCAAFEVCEWPVGASGLLYDRSWMVVNSNGVCLSQKREPRLCQILPQVHLSSGQLTLRAPGPNVHRCCTQNISQTKHWMDNLLVPLESLASLKTSQRVCQSKVCGDRVETVDCGAEAATWLSDFLGEPCRLIRQSPDSVRDGKKRLKTGASSAVLSLVNEAQYLLINRASVDLIQEQIRSRQEFSEDRQPLDTQNLISRFRANLVIAGVEPFEEDTWSQLIIGNARFLVGGRCERCQMICVDQDNGTKTKAPLLALASCRTGKLTFGVYLSRQVEKNSPPASTLSVGSAVLHRTSDPSL